MSAASLMQEIERLERLPTDEVGVPMILVPAGSPVPPGPADPLGAEFAEAARLLEGERGPLGHRDVAALLEVLATRRVGLPAGEAPPGRPPPSPEPELLDGAGWEPVAERLAAGLHVLALNIHATPPARREEFAAQIARLAEGRTPLTEAALDELLAGVRPPQPLAAVMLFEGFREQRDMVLPAVEAAGLTAWLWIPPAFIDLDPEDQHAFAAAQRLSGVPEPGPDGRIALSWDELAEIAGRGHVVACHSRNHAELTADRSGGWLDWEIAGGQALMERRLGQPASAFVWRRGAGVGLNPDADVRLRAAGFRTLLSNLGLQRLT